MKNKIKYISLVGIILIAGIAALYAHTRLQGPQPPQATVTDGDCLQVNVMVKAPNNTGCIENCVERVVIYRTDGWYQVLPFNLYQTSYVFCMPVPFTGTVCATLLAKDDPACYNCLTITPDCVSGSWTINSAAPNLTIIVHP